MEQTPHTNLKSEPMPPDPIEDASAPDRIDATPSLEAQLTTALAKAAENWDAFLRAKAEGENIRKRAIEDVAKAHKYAIESLAAELPAVRDSLEAALATPNASLETLLSGVDLTLKQLASVFDRANLRENNPVGEKFDPHRHQAIGAVESDQAPNTVVTVLQKGYLLSERVVRPALVMVAKARNPQ